MRYLEDFSPGQKFGSGRLRVERDRIKEERTRPWAGVTSSESSSRVRERSMIP